MKNITKLSVLVLVVLFVAFWAGNVLGAGKYPEKPITIVSPCGAGCGADILARAVAASFKKYNILSQPIVVENKPGSAHAIGNAYVAGKKKDPYYLVATSTPFITTPLLGGTPFNYKSFSLICKLANEPYIMLVAGNSKYKSMKDLVADAKARPKEVTFGGAAFGGADFVSAHRIEKAAGFQFNNISYEGGASVMAALLGGHVDMAAGQLNECLELYRAGKVRIIGILSEKRMDATPEVPTMMEQGINVVQNTFRGFAAPLGIPEDARKVLEEAFHKYYQSDDFKKFAKDFQLNPEWMDGAAFEKWIEEQNLIYTEAHKAMGIAPKK
jgi:tripartite-type tricarboxylate transporter receptor subunit TctC